MDDNIQIIQWALIFGSSLILFFLAPWSKTVDSFYKGKKAEQMPTLWVLASSLVISWLFAKSITNAANLGMSFGIVGGVAYAAYYLSFIIAGCVLYSIRVKGGFKSIHDFLRSTYGRTAVQLFTVLICFRLFNEVWSNTMVIGSYFGGTGSLGYILSIVIFTGLTLGYTLKGGFSSSLLTDVIQMALFGVLLITILTMIIPMSEGGVRAIVSNGEWTLSQGGNLLLVAILQSLSYPFHDPVLTDRAFLSSPKLTLKAFIIAGLVGGLCIILFSFVGIFGNLMGLEGEAPVAVAKLLGVPMMLIVNFIMITSAASTLDSTFSSFAKLSIIDLKILPKSVSNGRLAMIAITVLGTIPIFFSPEILSATTVSGTMVIGLAPVFICWKMGKGFWSFNLPVFFGMVLGLGFAFFPSYLDFGISDGKHSGLLGVNMVGTVICFILFIIGNRIDGIVRK